MERKAPSNIENVLMLSFNNSILLRSLNTSLLMEDSFRKKKITHGKFSAIIRPKTFQSSVKLIFNIGNKVNKTLSSFIFRFEKYNPSKSRIIIDKS
ncbi:hypothetical protein QL285_017976 [Trifolium repens]|nr:hypothetical protein QL285_017976 [Trifolium repens]